MNITQLKPHQQRVVQERDELQTNATKLSAFINDNPEFNNVDDAEKARLVKQNQLQFELLSVLNERIAFFGNGNPAASV